MCPWRCHWFQPVSVTEGQDVSLHDEVESGEYEASGEVVRDVVAVEVEPVRVGGDTLAGIDVGVHRDGVCNKEACVWRERAEVAEVFEKGGAVGEPGGAEVDDGLQFIVDPFGKDLDGAADAADNGRFQGVLWSLRRR